MIKPQPWEPADATDYIRKIGTDPEFNGVPTMHYKERLLQRDLIQSDVKYLLKNGFVYQKAESTTDPLFFKYAIEGKTPNSESRSVRLVVIPDFKIKQIKFVTIMWADEN